MLIFLCILLVLVTIGLFDIQHDKYTSTVVAVFYTVGVALLALSLLATTVLVWAKEHGYL